MDCCSAAASFSASSLLFSSTHPGCDSIVIVLRFGWFFFLAGDAYPIEHESGEEHKAVGQVAYLGLQTVHGAIDHAVGVQRKAPARRGRSRDAHIAEDAGGFGFFAVSGGFSCEQSACQGGDDTSEQRS